MANPFTLEAITFKQAPNIPGIRAGAIVTIEVFNPVDSMRNWRAHVRGPAVYLVSPPGWTNGRNPSGFDKDGPCTIVELPRTECYLKFRGQSASDIDALVKSGKYDSEPFGKPAPIVVPQEDAGFLSQLEGAQSQLGDA